MLILLVLACAVALSVAAGLAVHLAQAAISRRKVSAPACHISLNLYKGGERTLQIGDFEQAMLTQAQVALARKGNKS